MFEDLSNITDEILETEKKLKIKIKETALNQFKPAIKEAIIQLRELVPELIKIEWTQYTPYFNDGEPCEFSVNEPYFYLSGLVSEEEKREMDDEGLHPEEREDCIEFYSYRSQWKYDPSSKWGAHKLINEGKLSLEAAKAMANFSTKLLASEALLKVVFGDHTKVLIDVLTGDIESESYDHE